MTEPTAEEIIQQRINKKVADIGRSAIPFGALIRRFSPEPIPRIPGVLPGEEVARRIFVTAPSKNLKTWVVYETVYSLGTGEDFLNCIPLVHGEWEQQEDENGDPIMVRVKKDGAGEPLKTLYLQMENTEYSMEVRGRAIAEGHGHTISPDDPLEDSDFIMIVPRMELNLLDPIHQEAIIRVAQDFDIVVMDSTYNMVPRTLNDDEVAKELTRIINRMVDEAGVTIIAIHHSSTKGDGGGQKGRESMGSTFFTSAFWDHEIRLNYDREDRILNFTFVSRDEDYEDLQFRFHEAGIWELVDPEREAREALDEALGKIRDWLEDDPNNRVYEVGNGAIKIGGQFSSQGDLAAHLGLTHETLKQGLRHWINLQKFSHGPVVD